VPRGERVTRVEEALAFFPDAEKQRPRSPLSGGQQQMLAVAQGLVASARHLDDRPLGFRRCSWTVAQAVGSSAMPARHCFWWSS
jgi:hypothetical protein